MCAPRALVPTLLVAILVLGVVLRARGIAGPPGVLHFDEPAPVEGAVLLWEGVTPRGIGWPASTLILSLSALFLPFFLWRNAAALATAARHGGAGGLRDEIDLALGRIFLDGSEYYLLGRVLIVAVAAATLLVVFLLVRERFSGEGEGRPLLRDGSALAAALAAAVQPVHALYSHYVLPDVVLGFFLLLFLFLALRFLGSGRPAPYLGAAACLGLAVASKFNAGLFLVPLLALPFLAKPTVPRLRLAALGAASAALAFVLACPFIVTNTAAVLHGLFARNVYQLVVIGKGAAVKEGNWFFPVLHDIVLLRHGIAVGVLGGPAVLFALARGNARDRFVALCALFYLVTVGFSAGIADRWLIPLFLCLLILIAVLAGRAAMWLAARRRGLATLAIVPFLALAAADGVRCLRQPVVPPGLATVEAVRAEIERTLPPGARVAIDFYAERFLVPAPEQLRAEIDQTARQLAGTEPPSGGFFLSPVQLREEILRMKKKQYVLRLLERTGQRGYRVVRLGGPDRYRDYRGMIERGELDSFVFAEGTRILDRADRQGERLPAPLRATAIDAAALVGVLDRAATRRVSLPGATLYYLQPPDGAPPREEERPGPER